MHVTPQNMLMDNDEVRIMHIEKSKLKKADKEGPNSDAFDEFLQRQSYFVIPKIDKLKKDKLQLKR